MKYKLLTSILCGTSAMIHSEGAQASSVTLVPVREVASQQTAVGVRDVYRIYAQFENPADRVHRWYGNAASPMTIQNVLSDGVTLGSGFTQIGGSGGQFAPKSAGSVRDWDTYATLGVLFGSEAPFGSDGTTLSPGFPVFITGNSLITNNAAVSFPPPFEPPLEFQCRADWRVTGNDTNLRVLLMQLTVMPGQHVRGILSVDGWFWNGTAYEDYSAAGLTFASIPAPGGLVTLLMAVVISGRRRRTMN